MMDAPQPPKPLPAVKDQGDDERGSGGRNIHATRGSGWISKLYVPPGLSNGKLGGECEGLDPREIDLAVLTQAGHPPRRTRDLVNAYLLVTGGEIFSAAFARIKRHKDIRAYCKECVDGNEAEVRRCTTFWCPFWPYRMGCNPHNPQRGKPLPHLHPPKQGDGDAP